MRNVAETVAIVARSNVPVLVMGESGTGKEVVAQLLHRWSGRSSGPLVAANCAGLPETLIESELFGHTKGAFTGTAEARQAYFARRTGNAVSRRNRGIAFTPATQAAAGDRDGQDHAGGRRGPIDVDARGWWRPRTRTLGEAVESGRFRDDLYYRINVVELVVPR